MATKIIILTSSTRALCRFPSSEISRATVRLLNATPVISWTAPCSTSPQVRHHATKQEIQENITKLKEGKFDTIPDPGLLEHFSTKRQRNATVCTGTHSARCSECRSQKCADPQSRKSRKSLQQEVELDVNEAISSQQGPQGKDEPPMGVYAMPHPIWSEDQLLSVKITHTPPSGIVDRMAYSCVQALRGAFDIFSGFKFGYRNEMKWLKRIIFLETVAAVPGMVAAMMRHMMSLRRMQRDHGWIHTLLEEAENERMHLMTALQIKKPSMLFRLSVIGSQGVFVTMFFVWYAISPKFCHRFVGYLEEEAVKTYTKCLEDIDHGSMKHWNTKSAPPLAITYWKLPETAVMRDVILAIRADEAHHRVVNHTLASLNYNDFNPYKPGQ